MCDTTCVTGNALLYTLMEAHKVKSDLIKDVHLVPESDLNDEKICVDYTNGDIIEFMVDDENNSVTVILTPEQQKTNFDKFITGKLVYRIPKWKAEFGVSQISAYLARMMYVVVDVQAMYKTGKFTALCTGSASAMWYSLLHRVKEFMWLIKSFLLNLLKF